MNQETSASLKLFVVLSRAYKSINEYVNTYIQKEGLNPTEFAVLELLYHKGDQALQQIGGKILIASGSITYVVDKLEKKGLVKRIACPKDRRVTYGQITQEGRALLDEFFPKHEARIHEVLSSLSNEEKEQAIHWMKRIGKEAGKKLETDSNT
ncbi:MarR family winged helix-turn-helix transcriptional regulator [Bacillus fonticola]|uniref:MarR family winged helix-turn-helix transcriptional regulator n=1 Tax=Bacillus fonticola TaxID=2728853 RepID=UPI001472AA97|nr:MarR family transcriptional regulator [Bacillus fonticola]